MSEQRYYIASLKHTNSCHEHITWWGRDHSGYTPVVGDHIGEYSIDEAKALNDGESYIAVPVETVNALTGPEPHWKPGARFYYQRGPVVDNDRKKWNRLIDASLEEGRKSQPKPRLFRGRRRAIFNAATELSKHSAPSAEEKS
jgi:hypothetical protein